MSGARLSCVDRRHGRRWSFASCVLDEDLWSLSVKGRRVALEGKPLELLHELLLAGGKVVSKEELLDRIWPDVTVVEASLPTAVHKLRAVLGSARRDRAIIETVAGIGYRLGVPAEVEERSRAGHTPLQTTCDHPLPVTPAARPMWSQPERLLSIAGGIALAVLVGAFTFGPGQHVSATNRAAVGFTQRDAAEAIRELDIPRVKRMIAAGWNPATVWDKEGNDPLGAVLNRCEWDSAGDRRQMLLMARTLIEAGAPIDRRNVWGDTAYSIAKAPRYCGPDHPVTQMLEAMCYGGDMGPKDRCLATYELTAEQRRAQGLPPKELAARVKPPRAA